MPLSARDVLLARHVRACFDPACERQVLGRTRPNGESLLSVSAVVDGIVTFEELGDAERFAGLLEADGLDEVCGHPGRVCKPQRCSDGQCPCFGRAGMIISTP